MGYRLGSGVCRRGSVHRAVMAVARGAPMAIARSPGQPGNAAAHRDQLRKASQCRLTSFEMVAARLPHDDERLVIASKNVVILRCLAQRGLEGCMALIQLGFSYRYVA